MNDLLKTLNAKNCAAVKLDLIDMSFSENDYEINMTMLKRDLKQRYTGLETSNIILNTSDANMVRMHTTSYSALLGVRDFLDGLNRVVKLRCTAELVKSYKKYSKARADRAFKLDFNEFIASTTAPSSRPFALMESLLDIRYASKKVKKAIKATNREDFKCAFNYIEVYVPDEYKIFKL